MSNRKYWLILMCFSLGMAVIMGIITPTLVSMIEARQMPHTDFGRDKYNRPKVNWKVEYWLVMGDQPGDTVLAAEDTTTAGGEYTLNLESNRYLMSAFPIWNDSTDSIGSRRQWLQEEVVIVAATDTFFFPIVQADGFIGTLTGSVSSADSAGISDTTHKAPWQDSTGMAGYAYTYPVPDSSVKSAFSDSSDTASYAYTFPVPDSSSTADVAWGPAGLNWVLSGDLTCDDAYVADSLKSGTIKTGDIYADDVHSAGSYPGIIDCSGEVRADGQTFWGENFRATQVVQACDSIYTGIQGQVCSRRFDVYGEQAGSGFYGGRLYNEADSAVIADHADSSDFAAYAHTFPVPDSSGISGYAYTAGHSLTADSSDAGFRVDGELSVDDGPLVGGELATVENHGTYGLDWGRSITDSGYTCMAMGYSVDIGANAQYSAGFGQHHKIEGDKNFVAGWECTTGVDAGASIVVGFNNKANAINANIFGSNSDALWNNSYLFGRNLGADTVLTWIIGKGLDDTYANRLRNPYMNSIVVGLEDTTPTMFINGRLEKDYGAKDHAVGIGTCLPQERLHVVGNVQIDSNAIITGNVTADQFIGDGTHADTADVWAGAGQDKYLYPVYLTMQHDALDAGSTVKFGIGSDNDAYQCWGDTVTITDVTFYAQAGLNDSVFFWLYDGDGNIIVEDTLAKVGVPPYAQENIRFTEGELSNNTILPDECIYGKIGSGGITTYKPAIHITGYIKNPEQ